MSKPVRTFALLVALAWVLAGLPAHDVHAQTFFGEPETLGNEYIEVRSNQWGQFTIGTAGGDPATGDDDERRLMYGHGRPSFTSFTTVRTVSDGVTSDVPLLRNTLSRPRIEGEALLAEWQLDALQVTQSLSPANNPYTNRPDTIRIAMTMTNTGSEPIDVGLRIMLDTMIGSNDDAPFFVPGAGNFDTEREFGADEMPIYWKAFESPEYDEDSLKGQGIITGLDATKPDRFVFASWRSIKNSAWDYTVTPNLPVGDSAVAMYWEPRELAAGASVTFVTYYGLAGVGGGNAWIDAPVNITSEEPEFSATLWVANLSEADFTGGEAEIVLPEGLRLAADETARKLMPTVPVNGGAESVTWRLVAEGAVDADYPYSATVTFATGSGPLSAAASVNYRFIAPLAATADPTPTVMPTPEPTETPVAPVVVPVAPAPDRGFPWPWLLLIPLLLLPLLLLLRRQPSRPVAQTPPPRVAGSAAPPDFTEQPTATGPYGADVTHGRKKRDADEQPY